MSIDLSKFCGKEAHGTYLAPWSAGEYSHATNGHILVRVPRRTEFGDRENAPNVENLYDAAGPAMKLSPLPHFTAPEPSECEDCKGSGLVVLCEECDGAGRVDCESCGQDTDCSECDNNPSTAAKEGQAGATRCDVCDGIGSVDEKNARVEFAPNVQIKLCYARMLKELPNVRIDLTQRKLGQPIRFAFDGGDGLIMAMRASGGENLIKADGV